MFAELLLAIVFQGSFAQITVSSAVDSTQAVALREHRHKQPQEKLSSTLFLDEREKLVASKANLAPVAVTPKPKPASSIDERPGIAALDLVAVSGIENASARLINEAILSRLKATDRFSSVLGSSDLQAMLSMEQQKAALGCEDDGCLAELGGALGVPLLFSADVGKVGGRFMLNMKILRVDEANVAARLTLVYASVDEMIQELNEAVDALSAKVFGEAIPESVIARSSTPIERTAEQRAQRLRKFLIAGSTVLVGTGGALAASFYLDAEQHHFNGLASHQSNDFERLHQAQNRANIGLGVGVGVALLGGVLFW